MENKEDVQSVIQKIRKLLELAQNNPNEHEAATAFATAQKLQTKYRIAQAVIDAEGKVEISFVRENIFESTNKSTWRSVLADFLASFNGCKCYHTHGHRSNYLTIFGQKHNIDLVRMLFDSISMQIDWMTKTEMWRRNSGKLGAKTYANNFRNGMLKTIRERMQQAHDEALAEASKSAIVLLKNESEKVNSFVRNNYTVTVSTAPKAKAHPEGFLRGMEAGKNVDISNKAKLK